MYYSLTIEAPYSNNHVTLKFYDMDDLIKYVEMTCDAMDEYTQIKIMVVKGDK